MRVWRVVDPDGPFREEASAIPEPAIGEVLVRVSASAVNPLDTKIRAGRAAHAQQPLPAVLGIDFAGTVERVSPGETRFKPGDEVYGMAGGVAGLQGSLAEFVCVDADLIAHKPRTLSMVEASAMPLSIITAWEGLVDKAQVHHGALVLIHAGAGGVGHMAVQLALFLGARVHATVSPDKAAIVEGYGATPIDYLAHGPEEYIKHSPGGNGWDVVYDTVGGAVLDASFKVVKPYTGRVVSCLGWGTHSLAPLSFRAATYSGVFTLLPLLTGKGRENHGKILERATEIADMGKLRPLINQQVFDSSRIEAAYEAVTSGSVGKIVVRIRQ